MVTANDFYDDELTPLDNMIKFAQYHRKKALKAARAVSPLSCNDVIKNCYPKENIK
jgi:hypothetical protein